MKHEINKKRYAEVMCMSVMIQIVYYIQTLEPCNIVIRNFL